jgi:hypothetical protein
MLSLAILTTLSIDTAVWANAGPAPVPKGKKVIEPVLRFEGIDKHADHVFYLRYAAYYFEGACVEVKDASPVKVAFKNRGDRMPSVSYVALLAVERQDFDKRKKDDPSLKWMMYDKPGVLEAKLPRPETTAPIESKDVPEATYRVSMKDGKLHAEPMEMKKKDADQSTGLLPTWMFGIVCSLSITWCGIWFARKNRAIPNY